MAKRKDSLALLEVMGRKPTAPIGAPVAQAAAGSPPAVAPTTDAAAEAAVASPVQQALEARAPAWDAKPPPAVEPIFSRADDQVRVSLNYTGLAVAGAGLLVLLLGVFYLGRVSVRAPRAGVAPDGPAEIGPDGPLPTSPPGALPAGGAKRQGGKYYLIVQGAIPLTPEGMHDAEKIVEFLKANGEAATVEKKPAKSPSYYVVQSLVEFDNPDKNAENKAKAGEYAQKIGELGKRYMASGGRYNFKQSDGAWFMKED